MESKGTIGIVVRVSDVKGRDKRGDRFISPDEQIRSASAYVASAGFEPRVIEPYDLNVSHTTPLNDRPAMGEALRLVAAGDLVGVAVSSQDRIGTLALTRELKARLIETPGILKVADNPAAEVLDAKGYLKLPSEYMSLMHEAQREEIGLRWATAGRNARERGVLPRREPYGYKRRKDGRVAVDRVQADRVREAFGMRAEGVAFSLIARRFRWAHSTTRQRLGNRDYCGIDGLLPEIVTRDLFDAANAARTTQPVPPGDTTKDCLLRGIARCAGCGRTLKVVRRVARISDGVHVAAYFCKDASTQRCPDRAYVHCDALDDLVTGWFTRALASAPRMIDVVAAARDLEEAQADRAKAESELVAYVEAASALDAELFRRGLAARQAKVDEARERVQSFSGRFTGIPSGGSLLSLWETFEPAERRQVLAGFLDRVDVSRGASSDLLGHVAVVWADGSVAEIADDEQAVGVAAA